MCFSESKQEILKKLHDKSHELNEQIEKFLNKKESKMVEILELQTRAKWYRSIKAKKYKLSKDSDDAALNEIAQMRDQNGQLRSLLMQWQEEFPFYRRNLQKALATLAE